MIIVDSILTKKLDDITLQAPLYNHSTLQRNFLLEHSQLLFQLHVLILAPSVQFRAVLAARLAVGTVYRLCRANSSTADVLRRFALGDASTTGALMQSQIAEIAATIGALRSFDISASQGASKARIGEMMFDVSNGANIGKVLAAITALIDLRVVFGDVIANMTMTDLGDRDDDFLGCELNVCHSK